MKSIRRSLILNLLILFGLTLGAVFGIVYQTSYHNLEDKKQAVRKLLDLQFEEQRDEAIRQQAFNLANVVQAQFTFDRPKELDYAPLSLLSVVHSPYAHVQMPLFLLEGFRWQPWQRWNDSNYLQLLIGTKIHPNEDIVAASPGTRTHEYLQINSPWGSTWHSPNSPPSLELESGDRLSNSGFSEHFEDRTIESGEQFRTLVVKAPLSRFRSLYWEWPAPEWNPRVEFRDNPRLLLASSLALRPAPPPKRPFGPPPGTFLSIPAGSSVTFDKNSPTRDRPVPGRGVTDTFVPNILIQVAWNLDSGHPKLVELESKRDQQLSEVDAETEVSLRTLRTRLFWIGIGTLSILVIGGWSLVGMSLKPLTRLSESLSRISPKDFQLPIETKELPVEVTPVSERLRETLAQLKEAFEREKRASADISHELRTPLAALKTTLEVALRKERTPESYRETLNDCRAIAKTMSHLVERMLMLAWIDAGADKVRPCDVEIEQLVSECSSISKPLAEAQGLRFQVRMPSDLKLHTDPDKLREVLMNLLHNAIEYNRPGGEVELSAKARETGGIILEVRDTGIGVPPEIQQKIFERFYRGDPSRNAVGIHAGLGLAIVKEYIDRLGGKLILDSTVGVGSRFRIELPNV